MPPPISPQGSRTGLVTALVVFVILFVTTTILWIYENAERRNRDQTIKEMTDRYNPVVAEPQLTSADVSTLIEAGRNSNQTAIEAAIAQRKELAKTISGREVAQDQVKADVQAALNRAMAPDVAGAGVKITKTDALANVVRNLSDRVASLQNERAELSKAVEAAKGETQKTIAGRDALLKNQQAKFDAKSKEYDEALAQLAEARKANEERVTASLASGTTAIGQAQQAAQKIESELNQANATIQNQDKQIKALTERLRGVRVGPNEATVQKADGEIVRVPSGDLAIINLGLGDQIVQGMTFEVYDKVTGIPALGDGEREGDMPAGKASVEVIRIGPGYSEARVIRKQPGQTLVQGDQIVNLVYDPTQKYNFVVYGDFDLNNDGRTETADADVIKRLITQWGGRVVNDVNVNTDFVVMGVEPTAEAPTGDNPDAVQLKQFQEQQEALRKYLDVREAASKLNIPILNQNRFLNFVGYASQAAR
jgi:hypothetical protein